MAFHEGTIGEVSLFAGNFEPRNWLMCNGQILSIAQNTALFSILGTTYGGNGQTTFGLPDLRGRAAVGWGSGPGLAPKQLGEIGGRETVTILSNNMPAHIHTSQGIISTPQGAIVAGDSTTPENNYLALSPKIGSGPNATTLKTYATPSAATALPNNVKPMVGNTVTGNTNIAGSTQPISISNPYLALTYVVCLYGVFPSRN